MIKEKIINYIDNKKEISMDMLIKECLNLQGNIYERIRIGKIIKKLGWYRYKDKNNKWYYSKTKKLTWEESVLNNTNNI